MSKKTNKPPNKFPLQPAMPSKQAVPSAAKQSPLRLNASEMYSYTPTWITPEEKAKLKARVLHIKQKEHGSRFKEDVKLLGAGKEVSAESATKKDDKTGKGSEGSPEKENMEEGGELREVSEAQELNRGKSMHDLKGGEKDAKQNRSKDDLKMAKKTGDGSSKDNMNKTGSSKDNVYKTGRAAHSNPTGNTMEKQPERVIKKSEIDEHLWATDTENFDPQLYHFKSPEKLSTKNPVLAECPPFWVLLDHTIAVTWKLFSPNAERKDLGIIPLQWSREFVGAMRDERGEYQPAVAQLLSAIEDALIDRYAKAADKDDDEGKEEKADKKGKSEKDDEDEGKKDEKHLDSISYVSSESIFKYPMEVSYTLKDIMSRNLPGRQMADGEDGGVTNIADPAKLKIDVPPPSDDPAMTKVEMINYLRQLKSEQEARVEKEKEHADKIEALMNLIQKGTLNGESWIEGHEATQKGKETDAPTAVKGKRGSKTKLKGAKDDKTKGKDNSKMIVDGKKKEDKGKGKEKPGEGKDHKKREGSATPDNSNTDEDVKKEGDDGTGKTDTTPDPEDKKQSKSSG